MNGSSNDILAGVSPAQIRVLLDVLHNSTWRNHSFVERRYRERARNFTETLTFLLRLGWIRTDGTELSIAGGRINCTMEQDSVSSAVALLEAILSSPGEHQGLFADYLARFQNAGGMVSYMAHGELALAKAPVRDFMMELGAVRHEQAKKTYFLDPAFFGAYLWAVALNGPQTPAALLESIEDRQRLGRGAELAILAYERQRLGDRWAEQIQHVSGRHPASLYDIRSVTVTGESAIPRYIEVKAVSPLDHAFHWSAAEIEAARLLSENLYLYLVPVRGSNDYDISNLQIIANPYAEVYSQTSAWDKLPTDFLCRPARHSTS